MVLPIYLYGSLVLEEKCQKISSDDVSVDKLIYNMFETLKKSKGIGLAAPQVGESLRVFIINTSFIKDLSKKEKIKEVFINPEIITLSKEKEISNEGCLSIPFLNDIPVERSKKIKVIYYNQKWEKKEIILEGRTSIVFQHEFDHLEGTILTHKLSKKQKKIYKKQIEDFMLDLRITYSFESFEETLKFFMSIVKKEGYLKYPASLF